MAFPVGTEGLTYGGLNWDSVINAWVKTTTWTNLSLDAKYPTIAGVVWTTPQYRKVGDVVEIRGIHGRSTGLVTGDPLATLPINFRPFYMCTFILQAHSNLNTGHRIDVNSDGTIVLAYNAGIDNNVTLGTGTPWINYDGLSFSTVS